MDTENQTQQNPNNDNIQNTNDNLEGNSDDLENNNEIKEEYIQKADNIDQEQVNNEQYTHPATFKPVDKDESWFFRTRNIIYYILGVIEILLVFRLIFRSLGANINNGFVAGVYYITKGLIAPFVGIFNVIIPGGVNQYIIEPATIIAMVVYAIIAYGIVKLIKVTAVSV